MEPQQCCELLGPFAWALRLSLTRRSDQPSGADSASHNFVTCVTSAEETKIHCHALHHDYFICHYYVMILVVFLMQNSFSHHFDRDVKEL